MRFRKKPVEIDTWSTYRDYVCPDRLTKPAIYYSDMEPVGYAEMIAPYVNAAYRLFVARIDWCLTLLALNNLWFGRLVYSLMGRWT